MQVSHINQTMRVTHEVRSLYDVPIIGLDLGPVYWPHDKKRVIQKPPRAYHLVESGLGTMLNDVSLWATSTHESIL